MPWTAYSTAAGITCGHLHNKANDADDCHTLQPYPEA